MEVGAAGPGSPNLDSRVQLNGSTGAPTHSHGPARSASGAADSTTIALEQLTNPQVLKLLGDIELHRSTQDRAAIEALTQEAVAYVAQGNVSRALEALSQVVTLDPEHGHELINGEASLAPIRVDAVNLLDRLSFESKGRAEHLFASASQAMGGSGQAGMRAYNPDAQIVMAVAGRLIESGQHTNFVRAGELAQAVLAYYSPPVPATTPIDFSDKRASETGSVLSTGRFIRWLKTLWRRAPLLILLVGWLFFGIACRIGALLTQHRLSPLFWEIWALGFLGLVGFQFYARIRNARF